MIAQNHLVIHIQCIWYRLRDATEFTKGCVERRFGMKKFIDMTSMLASYQHANKSLLIVIVAAKENRYDSPSDKGRF